MEDKLKKDHAELKEISMVDFEEKDIEQPKNFEDGLQLRRWMTEPEAKKRWNDINKDMVAGNLSAVEIESIHQWEKAKLALIAMRQQNPDFVAEILYPAHLEDIIERRTAQILALSLSKDGFLRHMEASKIIKKEISFGSTDSDEKFSGVPKEKELEWREALPIPGFRKRSRQKRY